jgi:16S rRNA (cytosine967-C5)-methyltransferase
MDLCGRLLENNNDPSKVFARRNALAVSAEDLEKAWAEAGVKAVPKNFDWVGDRIVYEFESAPAVTSLPGFAEGWFYVQDPSTLLAPSQMEVRPGMAVLDLCAAPGGKATMLAQLMGDEGLVVAEDSDSMRLRWVEENSVRLRLKSVRVGPGEPGALYDAVLVDAPCSNTGVMRRRVDLRWRIQESEILRLAAEQTAILHAASLRVKQGGTLVYSTCSIEPEENQQVAKAFVRSHPDYVLVSERELIPFSGNCDGAYVATLKRSALA